MFEFYHCDYNPQHPLRNCFIYALDGVRAAEDGSLSTT